MITVVAPDDVSERKQEHAAALELQRLIASCWPTIESSNHDDIWLIPAAKCYSTHPVKDLDILVFGELMTLYSLNWVDRNSPKPKEIFIKSFCLIVEVKSHSGSKVRFTGNQVEVLYKGKWSPTTDQSEKQKASLFQYLNSNGVKAPFIVNLIWLVNVPESQLPTCQHNILGSDATWETFLDRLISLSTPFEDKSSGKLEIRAIGKGSNLFHSIHLFSKKLVPSELDRKKMEKICLSVLNKQQYSQKLGKQLLVIRGNGGTGKTSYLLKIAHSLYLRDDAQILILTFNRALVSDISRIFALMGLNNGITEKNVTIQTIHSFMFEIFSGIGVLPTDHKFEEDSLAYQKYKTEALELVAGEPYEEIQKLIVKNKTAFNWDYIFIDEGQDWPTDERDILYSFYDPSKFVIADGIDQLIRTNEPINWRDSPKVGKNSQVIGLSKSLRLKSTLCKFVKAFASHLGFEGLNIEPDYNIHGGQVLILEGPYAKDPAIHQELMEKNRINGNSPVDMLFCIPPKLVEQISKDERRSKVGKKFQEWGYNIWDGADRKARGSYPTDLSQLRIVQYDSCRGLEGWIVVNLALDEFFDYKLGSYSPSEKEKKQNFFDFDQAAKQYALRWLMIPMTRAIDTLVIQVSSKDHFVTEMLRAAAAEYREAVEWRVINS